MYNAQILTQRIKDRAKQQNILIRDMLSACDLSINAISQITDKKGLSCFSLARIADYLDCSVDYLLGRTDIPEVNRSPEPSAPAADGLSDLSFLSIDQKVELYRQALELEKKAEEKSKALQKNA